MTDHHDTPDGQQPGEPLSRVDFTNIDRGLEELRQLEGSTSAKDRLAQDLAHPSSVLRDLADAAGEWLSDRADDVRQAVLGGWGQTEGWIKATLAGVALVGVTAVGGALLSLTVQGIAGAVDAAAGAVPGGSARNTGLLASITSPVWTYLRSHTQGLAVDARTAYAVWLLAVLSTGVLSCVTKSFGARLAWGLTGAATGWMVWHGAPATGREVAVGLTAIAWALLSIVALRKFRVGITNYVSNRVAPEVKPQVHVPAPVVKRVEINGRALKSLD
ncbi:hypothetical protein ABZ135_32705 [Streptomyces sp. NPDC006339]|uniref:hypothetical protein n=1 Tax=Streptomyces sp. NPDC006339 TaxID=3156755 RepID=UPI0033AB109C